MGVRLKFGLNRPIFRRRQPKFFWIFYFLISSADRRRDKNFKSTWREFFLRKSIKMKWERDSIDDEVPEIRQSVSSLTSVQVFIRVRPSWGGFQVVDYARRIGSSESKRESESACKESPLKFDTASGAILTGQDKTFYFDRIFLDDVSQKFLYNEAISGMVGDFFQGYNCTVFTYGQTGSGKTHTMGTEGVEKGREEIMGIIPRVVNEFLPLFRVKKMEDVVMGRLMIVRVMESTAMTSVSTAMTRIKIKRRTTTVTVTVGGTMRSRSDFWKFTMRRSETCSTRRSSREIFT